MKFLLDTHIWLWLVDSPNRVGRAALAAVKEISNELWLSPISTWEALTLHYKGRIEIEGDLTDWLARANTGVKESPLTHEIMIAARQLPLHQDPADRILAATALVLDMTLVTADEKLLNLKMIKTLPNR